MGNWMNLKTQNSFYIFFILFAFILFIPINYAYELPITDGNVGQTFVIDSDGNVGWGYAGVIINSTIAPTDLNLNINDINSFQVMKNYKHLNSDTNKEIYYLGWILIILGVFFLFFIIGQLF
jgi:hypothetical protein